jgi:hypothetical protein
MMPIGTSSARSPAGHEHEVRVDDLDVGRLDDVGGGDRAGPRLHQLELDRVRGEAPEPEPLRVEDDLGDILLDARDGGELVVDVPDLDGGDGCSLERREEHAPERVAQGYAVAGL